MLIPILLLASLLLCSANAELVARWPLNSDYGLNEEISRKSAASTTGGTSYALGTDGTSDFAVKIKGLTNILTIPNLNFAGPWTVAYNLNIVKKNIVTFVGDSGILLFISGGLIISLDSGKDVLSFTMNSEKSPASCFYIQQWVWIVITSSGTEVNIYCDGNLALTVTTAVESLKTSIVMGPAVQGEFHVSCFIAFDSVESPDQIFNPTCSRQPPTTTTTSTTTTTTTATTTTTTTPTTTTVATTTPTPSPTITATVLPPSPTSTAGLITSVTNNPATQPTSSIPFFTISNGGYSTVLTTSQVATNSPAVSTLGISTVPTQTQTQTSGQSASGSPSVTTNAMATGQSDMSSTQSALTVDNRLASFSWFSEQIIAFLTAILNNNYMASDPNEVLQMLYPNLPPDTNPPMFPSDLLLALCDDFSSIRTAPPNNNEATELDTAVLIVDRIIELDVMSQQLSLMGGLLHIWSVTTCSKQKLLKELSFVPSSSMNRIFVTSKEDIWLPSYRFLSSSQDIFMKSELGDDFMASIDFGDESSENYTLKFYHFRRGFFRTNCYPDISLLPFDVITCGFEFALEHSKEQVKYGPAFPLCPLGKGNTEWLVTKCNVEHIDGHMIKGNKVSTVSFQVTLSRIPDYYIVNIILPNMALTFLQVTSFVIAPNYIERPALTVTLLLVLIVGLSDFMSQLPKTADRVLMADYLLYLTWLSTAITLYHAFACYLSKRHSVAKKIKTTTLFWRILDIFMFCLAMTGFVVIHVTFFQYM